MYSFCYCMNWLITMDTLKVSPPVFFYVGPHCKKWYGSRHWTFPPVLYYILLLWQMTAEWQSHRIAFDMEVCMKQRYGIVLLCEQKMAPSDIHQRLLNVCGDWTVDVSSVRWWVVTATRSRWPCTPVAPQNEEWLGLFVCANWWITTRELSVDLDICFSALERMVATLEYHKFCSRWVPWTCDVVSPCWAGVKMMVHRVARMWIPHWLKSLRCCPQWVNWCTLTFGIGKGDPSGFPETQINHQLWPLYHDAD